MDRTQPAIIFVQAGFVEKIACRKVERRRLAARSIDPACDFLTVAVVEFADGKGRRGGIVVLGDELAGVALGQIVAPSLEAETFQPTQIVFDSIANIRVPVVQITAGGVMFTRIGMPRAHTGRIVARDGRPIIGKGRIVKIGAAGVDADTMIDDHVSQRPHRLQSADGRTQFCLAAVCRIEFVPAPWNVALRCQRIGRGGKPYPGEASSLDCCRIFFEDAIPAFVRTGSRLAPSQVRLPVKALQKNFSPITDILSRFHRGLALREGNDRYPRKLEFLLHFSRPLSWAQPVHGWLHARSRSASTKTRSVRAFPFDEAPSPRLEMTPGQRARSFLISSRACGAPKEFSKGNLAD